MRFAFLFSLFLLPAHAFCQDGTIDTSFGEEGLVHLEELQGLGASGQLVKVSENAIYVRNSDGIVIKMDQDGNTISGFGDNGWLTPATSTNQAIFARDIHVFSSGNFLLGGWVIDQYGHSHMAVQKHWFNGAIQNEFGTNGIFVMSHPEYENMFAYDVFKCDDGSILVCGYADSNSSDSVGIITRINEDGELDTEFGNEGLVILSGLADVSIENIIQVEETILVNGYNANAPYWLLGFTKWLDANGEPFGTNSVGGNEDILPDDLEPYGDERMIVSSVELIDPPLAVIRIQRFFSDGELDPSFGLDGVVEFGEIGETYPRAWDIEVQNDGKILFISNKHSNLMIIRLLDNGDFDPTFADNGVFTIDETMICKGRALGATQDHVYAIGSCDTNGEEDGGERTSLVRLNIGNAVGVENLANQSNALRIYPNPARSEASFEFELSRSQGITLELLDGLGRVVQTLESQTKFPAGKHVYSLNIDNDLSNGSYLLHLYTEEGAASIQLHINR